MEYIINLTHDDAINMWIATSDDVPGLVLESYLIEQLIEKVKLAIPELLSMNKVQTKNTISLCFMIRCEYAL